ncbi:MAG TPA: hypothetical protein VHT96_10215 [Clostridia bacterium]|nr:hypothetical protein [Clostridia bacterium]
MQGSGSSGYAKPDVNAKTGITVTFGNQTMQTNSDIVKGSAIRIKLPKGIAKPGTGSDDSDKLLGIFTVEGNRAYLDKGEIAGIPVYYGTGKVEGKGIIGVEKMEWYEGKRGKGKTNIWS